MRNILRQFKLTMVLVLLSCTTTLRASANDTLIDRYGVKEVVFASRQHNITDGHWYANFGYYANNADRKAYRAMGRLCRLNLATGNVTVLLDDPAGSVRDPQVHYDAGKILFSYRPGGTDQFHLYEINTDGSGLRQLTSGLYDDIEPTYLPDGSIIFCSSRCKRWVNCWLTQVAVLYRCDADGGNIRPISSNNEHENTPWPLPDGRILYQRWEYVDRSQVHYHHLWACNPDGTAQTNYYGNMHPGIVMIDAKPIPNTDNKVVAVFSPGHGRREHGGEITILTPKAGPDEKASARRVSKGANWRDPWALSENCFLVARDTQMLLMDGRGRTEEIYRLPEELARAGVQLHEPRPLKARPRERMIPSRLDLQTPTGRLILTNIYNGRRMDGVKAGEIKKLLVLETLPMPIHYTGGMKPISIGGSFTLERVLGTVPVEEDGSAYMELPALRSLFFVALDENDNSVKRMQSFLTVQPGETTSCVGCHENRCQTPVNLGKTAVKALSRPASKIEPIEGIPQVFDFPRDIQPILDKHCVRCHNYDKRDGRVVLTGDRGPIFTHSYVTLTNLRQFVDGRNQPKSNLAPRSIGTSASPLMKKINGSHYDVKLPRREQNMIRYWIESAAAYPGTYAALGSGMIGDSYENKVVNTDFDWPVSKAASEAIKRRCVGCHKRRMPVSLAHKSGSRHLWFNLSRPEKSLILLGPLAKDAGGYGACKRRPDESGAVFKDRSDPDYQKILAMCRAGKAHLERITRFDMPNFRPSPAYVREMKRYGILPADLPADTPVDVYATDRAYWESLWYRPPDHTAGEG